ncbi:MAG: hypothetical protein ACRDO8_04225 [Nocardioidaceae bacterium]
MNASATDRPHEPGWYEIRLQGRLGPRWSSWFDEMTLTTGPDGNTVLEGHVVDQAALHGLLSKLRDIGLPLISVVRVEADPEKKNPRNHNHLDPGD